uniref:Sulfotransferase domain-containing protein n=1 Tax=Zooxanthella nutricula TaxID=1333877 RepID=A0A6U9ILT9_9DINO|mmetsp:Transcript_97365/g.297461  ORF Transcript_97365/g.297461 Transcript_97365/m.297461 type:complete len:479 (+) Transcript_97365:165-1601(+)
MLLALLGSAIAIVLCRLGCCAAAAPFDGSALAAACGLEAYASERPGAEGFSEGQCLLQRTVQRAAPSRKSAGAGAVHQTAPQTARPSAATTASAAAPRIMEGSAGAFVPVREHGQSPRKNGAATASAIAGPAPGRRSSSGMGAQSPELAAGSAKPAVLAVPPALAAVAHAPAPAPWSASCRSFACICHKRMQGSLVLLWFEVLLVLSALSLCIFCCAKTWRGPRPGSWAFGRAGGVVLVVACATIAALVVWVFVPRGMRGHLELVHIPKNAGTSVEESGLQHGIQWGTHAKDLSEQQEMPDGNWCNRWHVPIPLLQGPNPYEDADVFCITRHPYERAVSEYSWLAEKEWAPPWIWRTRSQVLPACSARGMNLFLRRALAAYQRGMRYMMDCHFLPQAEYIWDKSGRRVCHHVFRLDENLTSNINALAEEKGYPVRMGSRQVENEGDCQNLTAQDLSEATKMLLQEVYADDFRLLDYAA